MIMYISTDKYNSKDTSTFFILRIHVVALEAKHRLTQPEFLLWNRQNYIPGKSISPAIGVFFSSFKIF